ncbi:putative homocysteine S-methyltransferase [Aspergillus clavatus NRRL 1]|uniref:Homocysteine S-methyltransferase, putative n=1 Tax=Aspergillus clavatus (strain ATCC 1007 / CBS 513.65 / DSM 816 / NCTC 3887 / NRRL 1 / QM 1276 / 107) TaxID=344612 RepID=A1CCT5_ASPCL|nr:homocysteine S-methyltransferase, putative [Aspergillus clavatus NRRL 1]EAW12342.1 homocysteine S-methyltransferase, putative [Aspergillus clavatus NRRL 1]
MTLPQLFSPKLFLAECGTDTMLVYKDKIPLPCFSSLPLVNTEPGRKIILHYYKVYIEIATANGTGIVLDTRTWRGAAPWAQALGLSVAQLLELNRGAVRLAKEARRAATVPVAISGTMGPLRDAYEDTTDLLTLEEARAGYREQVYVLADAGVDLLTLLTMTNLCEIIAVVELAREVGLPVVVSFMVQEDGRMLGGQSLESAIRTVDDRTGGYVSYYGVNCVHPLRIVNALRDMPEDVRSRIGMIKGNASMKSHHELDNTDTLDRGDIAVFTAGVEQVLAYVPNLRVLGGCCGTDEEHLEAVAKRCIK